MTKYFYGLAIVAGLLSVGVAAQAQISPFRGSRVAKGLSKAEVDALFQATDQLNHADPAQAGDKRDWTGPSGAAGGTVTLTRIFQSGALTCHALRYDFPATAKRPVRTYKGDWCKTAAGDWKIKD